MGRKEAEAKRDYREIAAIVDVYVDSGYETDQVNTIKRLMLDGMNPGQWATLKARNAHLPDWSREAFNDLIRAYWEWRCDNGVGKELKPKVAKASAALKRFTELLSEVRNDRDFFKGVFAYHNASPREQAELIDDALAQVGRVDQLLADAATRIKLPAHRPSHRAVWHTLLGLANLLQNLKRVVGTEFVLDHGPNSIAYPLMYLADPLMTKDKLRPVLKEFVATWPKWGNHMLYVPLNLRS